MDSLTRRFTHDDYRVACICPMGVEQAPVEAMLDELHPDLPTRRDKNSYTLGRMGIHNVVVVIMPEIGNNSAASVSNQLVNDFPLIRFSLLIGIGGGIPNLKEDLDIRLGDVVVSKPSGTFGGVVQFDRGKAGANFRYERTGALQRPPDVLLATVARLEAVHRRVDSDIPKYLDETLQKYPKMRRGGYVHQGVNNDRLFRAQSEHRGTKNCMECDPGAILDREPRFDCNPVVHYGTIGSSNSLIKDGRLRDQLREDLNIQCVEMEAAGVMDSFPCLVIRGICDYADAHKNKIWQPYAAAVAAAYAKELLSMVPLLNESGQKQGFVDSNPSPGQTTIHVTSARNFVNGAVSGDAVAGDKISGDKISHHT